jgi:hypothetical protein
VCRVNPCQESESGGVGAERLADSVGWHCATRDDLGVGRRIVAGEEPEATYPMAASTVLDVFVDWLAGIGVLALLESLMGQGIRRQVMPFARYVLIYFFRCLARVPSQNALPELLFADERLMMRIGFNAHAIEHGLTERGASKREGPRSNLPVDPEAVTKNIVKIPLADLRATFVGALGRAWSALPEVPRQLDVVIDGTLIACGESAKGTGKTAREKRVRGPKGWRTVTEYTTGYQIVWAYVPAIGLPAGVVFSKAGEDERAAVPELLEQVRQVMGARAQIRTIAIDRGFMSGPRLHAVAAAGHGFVIPARHDMDIYKDARREALDPDSKLVRHRKIRKTISHRRRPGGGPLETVHHELEVIGIEGLAFETYASTERVREGRHVDANKKTLTPETVNAVVVLTERGKPADMVILTNRPVSDPLAVFDRYDARSLIENEGNRSLKQDWHLTRPPQRSAAGAEIHALFTVLAFGLAKAHRLCLEHDEEQERLGKPSGTATYERKRRRRNAQKIIVFLGRRYGVYFVSELPLLFGRRVKRPNVGAAQTIEELWARLDASDPP